MRGCVSAGMIAAVCTLGLMDTFDAVYGSSAGSLIGAYAIAGQARTAVGLLHEALLQALPGMCAVLRASLRVQ